MRCSFALLFLLFYIAPVWGATESTSLVVNQILSGEDIALTDGQIVHLQGIATALGADPAADAQNEAAAKAMLQDLVGGKKLVVEGGAPDRYRRLPGPVYALDDMGKKLWLQGALLNAGLAFVYPPNGDESYLQQMLQAEDVAHAARRGLWANAAFDDVAADQADPAIGRFAFVRGKVLKAERVKNKVYLNFGADWRTDFTIEIAAHDLRLFKQAGIDPLAYAGDIVRVRGWVKRAGGPMITVTHPGQLQILGRAAAPENAAAP